MRFIGCIKKTLDNVARLYNNLLMSSNRINQSGIEDTSAANRAAYTLCEAATVLRMSEKSVRRQIDRGKLRRCTAFGRVLIPRKDVDTFMEKHSAYAF